MNGFTGFNPEQARKNITDTIVGIDNAFVKYFYVSESFFNDMCMKWASPKAVEFGEKYIPLVRNVAIKIYMLEYTLEMKAVDAYNAIATSNGYSTMEGDDRLSVGGAKGIVDEKIGANGFREEYYGVVGMNVIDAKNVLSTYTAASREVINMLDEINVAVAFYDPAGELATAYQNEVNKIKKDISDAVTSIETTINDAIETETNTVLIAKQNAADTMQA